MKKTDLSANGEVLIVQNITSYKVKVSNYRQLFNHFVGSQYRSNEPLPKRGKDKKVTSGKRKDLRKRAKKLLFLNFEKGDPKTSCFFSRWINAKLM